LGDSVTTGDTCTAGEEGKMKYAMDSTLGQNGMIYCNGTDWMSLTVTSDVHVTPSWSAVGMEALAPVARAKNESCFVRPFISIR
jgi:hypothetical protein